MKRLFAGTVVIVAMAFAAGTPDTLAQTKKPASDSTAKAAATLTIELYKDSAGEFRFRIKSGETLLASSGKGYGTKADVQKVIDNLKANLAKATTVDNSDAQPKGKTKSKDKNQ